MVKINFIFEKNSKKLALINLNKEKIKRLQDLINDSNSVLITTHQNADGDAIGSSLAFALVLSKLGKNVNVITPDDYPQYLKWMKGTEMIHVFNQDEKLSRLIASRADLIFAIDYNDPKRLASASYLVKLPNIPKVLIDHHPNPKDFTDLSLVKTDLGSSAELIYYIIRDLKFTKYIDIDVTEAIFTGIMTDTGCFSYSCSYPEVYEVMAELMKYGINKDLIYSKIYNNFSENRMKLMGYCLNEKMVIVKPFHVAYISVTRDELKRFSHEIGDTEGFVNLPFTIKGIRLTALFVEKDDHVKISFRSKNNFSVNEFSSKHFMGGGHIHAAGAEWKLPMTDAIDRFIGLLSQYKNWLL